MWNNDFKENKKRNDSTIKNFPALNRPFRVIAFDWDGTAVMSRQEDASEVASLLQQLLDLGVIIAIITGTNFNNVDRQVTSRIRGKSKRDLFVCTNRGSEVFGFSSSGQRILLWHRDASQEENTLLTTIADEIHDILEKRTGLDIKVVYDRLNRRKIDLIPLPEWSDPPKSEIGALLEAVEGRLRSGGLEGGLSDAFALAERITQEKGLAGARITSDVKHIEIGLTDKGDSIDWVVNQIVQKNGIPIEDVLIGGDEFGPIAGFPGSDYKMVTPATKGATFVSVGKEPNGVPPGIIYVGGGPDYFKDLLRYQIDIQKQERLEQPSLSSRGQDIGRKGPSGMLEAIGATVLVAPPEVTLKVETVVTEPDWQLVEEGFNPAREHEIESLFTVSNGYVGTRGSLPEGSAISRPATFIAGVFDKHTAAGAVEEIAIVPDWTCLRIVVEGTELNLDTCDTLEQRRILDMKRGLFLREWRVRDPAGRITNTRFMRFVSLADEHALYESVAIEPENYTGQVTVESIIDGRNATIGTIMPPGEVGIERPLRSETEKEDSHTVPVLVAQSIGYDTKVAFATLSILEGDGLSDKDYERILGSAWVGDKWEWNAEMAHTYCCTKLVSVFTTRETSDPAGTAATHTGEILTKGADSLLEDHERAWSERWSTSDVVITDDNEAQIATRFAIYHLISAANHSDTGASIGARGLTGSAYSGHVFWDTEVFMLPFYTFTHPPCARALLLYRHKTLPGAIERAKSMGYEGALYAWESTSTGQDVTPSFVLTPEGEVIKILPGLEEHHISADVAYAVWQYWQATKDDEFFKEAGAEILIQTARFWASRVTTGSDGLYHILKVIGPDEFHEEVDDSAYTNMMAQWNLKAAAKATIIFRDQWPEDWSGLSDRLDFAQAEADAWLGIAGKMYTGFDPSTGLIEQFKGYFSLEYVDLSQFGTRSAPMDVVLGRARIVKTQVIKQPDVVLLIYLLWDEFSPEVREANFRYYEQRTSHGSSLSPAICGLVAARLGDLSLAEWHFRQSAEIDLSNNMGNAALGVHLGALGGLWQSVTLGFGGMQLRQEGLVFDPNLPSYWGSLQFPVRWQDRQLRVAVDGENFSMQVTLESGLPMVIVIGEHSGKIIRPGEKMESTLIGPNWGPLELAS